MKSRKTLAFGAALAAGLAMVGTATATPAAVSAQAAAAESAATLVADHPEVVHASAQESFVRQGVTSVDDVQYVSYERTYKNLPVVGGDFVVVTDKSGAVKFTSVAQERALGEVGTTPVVSRRAAEGIARGQLRQVDGVEGSRLVVKADGAGRLAWETTVNGTSAEGPSRLTVYVDARDGRVIDSVEHTLSGEGTGYYNGPSPLKLDTKGSSGRFSMTDPNYSTLDCRDYSTGQVFTNSTDKWGNGDGASKETGCVDALYSAQTESKMVKEWLGRNGLNGKGGAWPIQVGWQAQNATYNGSRVAIGWNSAKKWISSMDVVGHEFGHGIDDTTPGGISRGNTQEFIGDTFGAATEAYANQTSQYDAPDYEVGEKVNLVGKGPIRYMYQPSKISGHPDCYSSNVPNLEVHAAAGPGNHWFYLTAEGSNPTNGQPTSPTCNQSKVTGLGIQKAQKILYAAMQMKTTSSSYPKYRLWTLQAAKNLYPNSCTEFNTVKAAWNAVSVPAQSGEPTC